MSILLRIAYDGTDFSGWARQKTRADGSPIRTVQGVVEAALTDLYGTEVRIRGASRTDAGVHARGQLAAYEPPHPIPAPGVMAAVCARLPPDVTIVAAWEEPGIADIRGANAGKRYRYRIRTTAVRDPIGGRDEWWLPRRLDVAAMDRAAQPFVGEHDFAAFRAAHCQAKTTVRTIASARVTATAGPVVVPGDPARAPTDTDLVIVDIEGLAFLHNMVRIMVGTLVEVGMGRRAESWVGDVLAGTDRRQAGPTAPACGLTLLEVIWAGLSCT